MHRTGRAPLSVSAALAIAACGGQSTHVDGDATDGKQQGGEGGVQRGGTGNGPTSGGSSGGRAGDLGDGGEAGEVGGSGGTGNNPVQCTDQDANGIRLDPRAYGTRGTTSGRNGSFVDFCDDAGNLIEHYCFLDRCFVDDCGPNEEALAEVIECPSGCRDGACFTWCPPEDTLVVISVADGLVTFEHDSGQQLVCSVDWSRDDYDCAAPELVGVGMVVQGTSACEPIFRLRVDDPAANIGEMHECEFLCHATP